jgi:ABC-type phosphate/phosphonate transport system substrate-binding protein
MKLSAWFGSPERIAALPMYDYPELAAAHDALWSALSDRLIAAGIADVPRELTRSLGHFETWQHPRLLVGQGCEYPLATSFSGSVRLVATPRYSAPGCEGATYRSAIVVRKEDPAERLTDLRGRRCVINEPDSNSGMNLLRAAIAPLAGGGPFFASVSLSGAHWNSAAMVAEGRADVAALDCVSFAHFRRLRPESLANLRILGWTASSRSPPFITARTTDDATLGVLRSALASVAADATLADTRARLFLAGFDFEPDDQFIGVLSHERQAAALGYPALV